MKKILKLLPFAVLLPTLVGCSANKIKKTEFQDVGEEITLEEFNKNYEEVKAENEFVKEDKLVSMIKNSYSAHSDNYENLRSGKLISKSEEKRINNSEEKYDVDHLISKSTTVENSSKNAKDSYGKSSSSSSSKKVSGVQQTISGEHVYFASIDHIRKEYGPYQVLDDDHKAEDVFDNWIKFAGVNAMLQFIGYEYGGEDEEIQKRYTYYQNGNIFTIQYDFEEEVENKSTVGEEELLDSILTIKDHRKYQLDLTNGKFSFKGSEEYSSDIKYERSFDENIVGDSHSHKENRYFAVSFEAGSVSLKTTDLSKYVKIGFDD